MRLSGLIQPSAVLRGTKKEDTAWRVATSFSHKNFVEKGLLRLRGRLLLITVWIKNTDADTARVNDFFWETWSWDARGPIILLVLSKVKWNKHALSLWQVFWHLEESLQCPVYFLIFSTEFLYLYYSSCDNVSGPSHLCGHLLRKKEDRLTGYWFKIWWWKCKGEN